MERHEQIVMKRNYLIDYIKVLFAISIACSHYKGSIFSAEIVVACFFVMSGYFLMACFESGKYESSYEYTKNRIKRIYLQYIIAFAILFIWTNKELLYNAKDLFKAIAKSLPEMFLVQNLGIFHGGLNYPLWQLCTLIFASHVLYSLLEKDKDFTLNVLSPACIVLVYTYLANLFNTHDVQAFGIEYKFLYVPLLRAFSSISIGMVAYRPMNEIAKYANMRLKGWQIFLCSFLFAAFFWAERDSYIAIIPFCVILMLCIMSGGLLRMANRKLPFSGEKLSLWIYLNHAFLINVLNEYNINLPERYPLFGKWAYIIILIIYSIIIDKLVEYGKKLFKRL